MNKNRNLLINDLSQVLKLLQRMMYNGDKVAIHKGCKI